MKDVKNNYPDNYYLTAEEIAHLRATAAEQQRKIREYLERHS